MLEAKLRFLPYFLIPSLVWFLYFIILIVDELSL
jgi:hypothetical protein